MQIFTSHDFDDTGTKFFILIFNGERKIFSNETEMFAYLIRKMLVYFNMLKNEQEEWDFSEEDVDELQELFNDIFTNTHSNDKGMMP